MAGERRATVAIAHTDEKHRTLERTLDLVREAVGHLGGMEAFVKPGQTVLIKPNQTVYYSAEEGCTTDPHVVGALIRLAKEAGAARVQVAESSGGFFSSMDCMKITGIAAMAEKEGAELIDLGSDAVPNRMVPIPNGEVVKEAPFPEPLLEADVIIDAPKAKNHHIEPISGALKNWVGTVNQNWRQYYHGGHPVLRTAMPKLMEGLGVARAGKGIMKWQQFRGWGMHNMEYGSPRRKALTVAKLLAAVGLAVAGAAAVTVMAKKRGNGA
jgi:uncharacterized protein (DUF362 family)